MMKKVLLLLFALSFLFSCTKPQGEKNSCEEEKKNETEDEKSLMKQFCGEGSLEYKGGIRIKII